MVILENNNVLLKINLDGGSYSDFHLKDQPLNPINWVIKDETQPPFKGHFLCFDRWGPPSEAEKSNGFTHHGEVNSQRWELINHAATSTSNECVMCCTLPMGGLEITRQVSLSGEEPLFFVSEKIRNLNKYGRMFNLVQHVTVAPPFLDRTTLFDNNTEKGFEDKEDGSLHQEEPVLCWPEAVHKDGKVDLRHFQDPWPRVSSFIYNRRETYGWVTASNPTLGVMLGYLWKVEDYPWINFWRSMENGNPVAFGMEFGTTGLHEPFTVVAKKGKIFDRNLYEFIDAQETIEKTFLAFLARIPEDFNGVDNIRLEDSNLVIRERGRTDRNIRYKFKRHYLG
ncbi:MAG TPA: hypothetical protein DEB36_02545 [Porphyromonadaceae bacterium]|nr:hypothetical protein [Porphyromonadaceae bacterium]